MDVSVDINSSTYNTLTLVLWRVSALIVFMDVSVDINRSTCRTNTLTLVLWIMVFIDVSVDIIDPPMTQTY